MTPIKIAVAMCFATAGAVFAVAFLAPVQRVTLRGVATAIDGDTIVVGPQGPHVRLDGVDAEELNEPHGGAAKFALSAIIMDHALTCKITGTSYERVVGICKLEDGTDIGARLIGNGMALDCGRYSGGRYRALEPTRARQRLHAKPYC